MGGEKKRTVALIGAALAMIALQVAVGYGALAGGRMLMKNDTARATLNAAGIVARNVAGTVAKTGMASAQQLASHFCNDRASCTVLAPRLAMAPSAKSTCWIVDPAGKVREVDVTKLNEKIQVIDARASERMPEIQAKLAERLQAIDAATLAERARAIDAATLERRIECARKCECQRVREAARRLEQRIERAHERAAKAQEPTI